MDGLVKWHKLGIYLCSWHCYPEIKLHRGYTYESNGLDISQALSLVTPKMVYKTTMNRVPLVFEMKAIHGPKT